MSEDLNKMEELRIKIDDLEKKNELMEELLKSKTAATPLPPPNDNIPGVITVILGNDSSPVDDRISYAVVVSFTHETAQSFKRDLSEFLSKYINKEGSNG